MTFYQFNSWFDYCVVILRPILKGIALIAITIAALAFTFNQCHAQTVGVGGATLTNTNGTLTQLKRFILDRRRGVNRIYSDGRTKRIDTTFTRPIEVSKATWIAYMSDLQYRYCRHGKSQFEECDAPDTVAVTRKR